jgi:hypothetical protein
MTLPPERAINGARSRSCKKETDLGKKAKAKSQKLPARNQLTACFAKFYLPAFLLLPFSAAFLLRARARLTSEVEFS